MRSRRQYTNLKPQVESGPGQPIHGGKGIYRKVNEMLGDIVKVTPLQDGGRFGHLHDPEHLTPRNIVGEGPRAWLPGQCRQLLLGLMGQPAGGFPQELQRVVLRARRQSLPPGELLPPVDF
jgi:pyruvate carboxylase